MSARSLVIVTGGAGRIGAGVARALARRHEVACLDPLPVSARETASWFPCELTDDVSLARALLLLRARHGDEVASVLHLAACADGPGATNPLYEQLTVGATRRLLRALADFRIEQFVLASRLHVMRPARFGEVLEEASPVTEDCDHPTAELVAERIVGTEGAGRATVILRVAEVYDEDCHSPELAWQMQRIYERRLESHISAGSPAHGRSFVHLDDLVACLKAVVEHRQELARHELFLVGEPELVSYGERQDLLGRALHGTAWTTIPVPARVARAGAWLQAHLAGPRPLGAPPRDAHLPVSIRRAEAKLGWRPRRALRAVLPEMARRMRADPAAWYAEQELEPATLWRLSS